jgi:hypothetical protein
MLIGPNLPTSSSGSVGAHTKWWFSLRVSATTSFIECIKNTMMNSFAHAISWILCFVICLSDSQSNTTAVTSRSSRFLQSKPDYSHLGHLYDQKLTVYFSNPRAASLFLSDRLIIYGSGRYQFIPKIEQGSAKTPSARWMMK